MRSVRRCGFAWSRVEALTNFGREQGTGSHRHSPSCAALGAVLPFPYAAGAGYVLSAATLRFLATPLIARWAGEASGARREELQWQKYEDSTTGYWLSYAPQRVHYLNVYRWVHDMSCRCAPAPRTGRPSCLLTRHLLPTHRFIHPIASSTASPRHLIT